MTTSAAPDETWPDTRRPTPPRRTARRVVAAIAVAVGVVVTFFGVTTFTGFPGPGPLRRYPASDLNRVADRINAADGVGSHARSATVDLLRSQVELHGGTIQCSGIALSPTEREMVDDDAMPGYYSCPAMPAR